jgi:hypothetical protein
MDNGHIVNNYYWPKHSILDYTKLWLKKRIEDVDVSYKANHINLPIWVLTFNCPQTWSLNLLIFHLNITKCFFSPFYGYWIYFNDGNLKILIWCNWGKYDYLVLFKYDTKYPRFHLCDNCSTYWSLLALCWIYNK